METRSMVLFLTTCSLNKAEGGTVDYNEGAAITSLLSPALKERLLERREAVRQLVKNDERLAWQGVPLSKLYFNAGLARGPDFGGRATPVYRPAIHRYDGRFLQAVGPEGRTNLTESIHHTLFLSGLYGLVCPLEPIQLYSCPLSHQVAEQWASDGLLTDVLSDYVERCGLAKVFELTAIDAYRRLIDWDRIRQRAEVLHCFDAMGAGDDALISFGKILASDLVRRSEDALVGVRPETMAGRVGFMSSAHPPSGYPSEVEAILSAPHEAEILQALPLESMPEYLRGGNPNPAGDESGDGARDAQTWRFKATSKFIKDVKVRVNLFDPMLKALEEIRQHPTLARGNTIKPLTRELKGKWRYRIGDHRLVYEPDSERRIVILLSVSHRKDVYE